MPLGEVSFTTQNKKLPGTDNNFVSAASATDALPDGGIYESRVQGNVYYGGILNHGELMEIKQR